MGKIETWVDNSHRFTPKDLPERGNSEQGEELCLRCNTKLSAYDVERHCGLCAYCDSQGYLDEEDQS